MPKVRDAIRLVEAHGWEWVRTRGSHRQFIHPDRPGKVTIVGKPSHQLAEDLAQYPQASRHRSRGRVMDYTVIYEETPTGFSAYLPDLPGCVAAGATRVEVERLIRSAVEMHLEAMREGGEPLPSPSTWADTVSVAHG